MGAPVPSFFKFVSGKLTHTVFDQYQVRVGDEKEQT